METTVPVAVEQTTIANIGEGLEHGRLDPWEENKRIRSREGQMMTFDDYRTSLGGGDNGWGTHVFYRTLIGIGLVEKCQEHHNTKSKYCPTEQAIERYPHFFYYDDEAKLWGLNNITITGEEGFDEIVLPFIASEAVKVRRQWKEEKRRRASAARFGKKNMTRSLF